jgi:alcohol dehydrogenase (NADP+)
VTAGCGWTQHWGGPVEDIRPGDVVWFPAGEKHWHGATATTAMTHIAVQEKIDAKVIDWMEKVGDEQYQARNTNSLEHQTVYTTKAYSAASTTSPLNHTTIPRRDPTDRDVQIEILFCGICHSDLHAVRDEWKSVMPTVYPIVPGHEIVGRVTKVGSAVTKHKPGDLVAVGCLVDSDRTCPQCKAGLEQFCPNMTFTYNSPDKHKTAPVTYGGYSDSIVVQEHFVLRVPSNLDLAGAAPLLCAGITTYSPLRHWGVTKGKKVGIVGLGGLGHMGVKFARAFGAHVVVFTTSPSKREDALRLGAHEVVLSRNSDEMKKHAASFNFILDAVAAEHDVNAYINLLARDGNITMVGAPEKPLPVSVFGLIFGRRSFSGSPIGGIAETQEMLDFCGEHKITADVEVIPIQNVDEAYERLVKSDVKYRFSIDMASLKSG